MLKVLIGGIAVGLANIIPGVSGGTMMVILGLFNRVMESISGILKFKSSKWKDNVKFLIVLTVGAGIGLVVFSKLLEVLFVDYPTQTMFCFVGMVAFSIPSLVKKEMKGDRFQIIPFVIGCIIIFTISYFAPEERETVVTEFPNLGVVYLVGLVFTGIIAGGAMFVPGVSGSMLLLIIGQYYLFKSLIANVTTFQLDVIIPLGVIGVGVVFGIIGSSKITGYCLERYHGPTMNLILGLVVASSVVLIPFQAEYNMMVVISSALALGLGGAIVLGLERIA